MWRFTEFHDEYRRKGWKQSDFASGVGYVPHLSVYLYPVSVLAMGEYWFCTSFQSWTSCAQNLTGTGVTVVFTFVMSNFLSKSEAEYRLDWCLSPIKSQVTKTSVRFFWTLCLIWFWYWICGESHFCQIAWVQYTCICIHLLMYMVGR